MSCKKSSELHDNTGTKVKRKYYFSRITCKEFILKSVSLTNKKSGLANNAKWQCLAQKTVLLFVLCQLEASWELLCEGGYHIFDSTRVTWSWNTNVVMFTKMIWKNFSERWASINTIKILTVVLILNSQNRWRFK